MTAADPADDLRLLAGRRLLVTGVLNRHSIAWHIAAAAQRHGAEVVLSSLGRVRRHTERAAARFATVPEVVDLDVTDLASVERAAAEVGAIDGLVHSIAYGDRDTVGGDFLATSAQAAVEAFTVSAHSLPLLANAFRPPLTAAGGAIVGLTFETRFAFPGYHWMGVAKAALEAAARYSAAELGPDGVRVNLVSAGPLRSFAARSVPGFDELGGAWTSGAPLGWDPNDATSVADACCFLLSPLARSITGEIVHVDGGMHAVASALRTNASQ